MNINWKNEKLGKICDVRDGTHDSPKYVENGYPFITSKNLSKNGLDLSDITFISEFDHKRFSQRSFVENGDILFGMIGTVGKPIIVKEKFEFSIKNVALLKFAKTKNLLNDFAIQVLKSFIIEEQFRRKSDGGVQSFVSLSTIRDIDFPVPPLPQQQKIAKILSTVDTVIEQTETAIAKYQAIKQGLMHDLFTRGIDVNTGKLRPTPQEAPELYKESKLGLIPDDWEVRRVDECLENLDGKRKPIKKEDRELLKGSIPYYGASGIIDFVNDFLFDEPLILLGEDGENVISRNTALAFKIEGKSWVNNHAHVLKPLKSYDIDFLTELLESMDYTNIISGSAQPKINQANLNKKLLSIPDTVEQINISKRINGLNQKIQTEQQALAKYQQLKAGLLQDLLTGTVGVGVD